MRAWLQMKGFRRAAAFGLAAWLGLSAGGEASAATARRHAFGTLQDGTPIEAVELTNGRRVSATVMTLGATLQALRVPDRHGRADDIVLGYDNAADYLAKPQYFGATVGRYANRIAHGRFSLDGRSYRLETNDGPNHLHGGRRGFDKRVWTIEAVRSGPAAEVVLAYTSPDGEEGYPGTLKVTATYRLDEQNRLTLEYRATTDKPTVVNITNHSFFNLAGAAAATDVMDDVLTLRAAHYTPVDATLIPTGELRSVAGTPFDFRRGAVIGARIRQGRDEQIRLGRGYDHNFVIDGPAGTLRPAVRIENPRSGRVMEIRTAAPGVQVYSGNFLDATVTGKAGRVYRQGDGIAFEPQVFPDSPNHPAFPSARLDPGRTYVNRIEYRFSTASRH